MLRKPQFLQCLPPVCTILMREVLARYLRHGGVDGPLVRPLAHRARASYVALGAMGAGTLVIEDLSLGKKKGIKRAHTQFIRLANRGATTLCLDGYRMDTQGLTYWFPSGTCLAPGATFTLHGGDRKSWSKVTYLDRKRPMFYLTGSAQVVSDRDQVLAERLW